MSPARKIRIRELSPQEGDLVKTITVEEARELDYKMVTVLPDGKVVHGFDELLEALAQYPEEEEPEVYRFPALAGG